MHDHPRTPRYVLSAPSAVPSAPELDEHQRSVVDHPGGPLLVLAGPGTGKTTTLVESVVERIEQRGVDPAEVLVLTFSRRAAQELRERIAARLGRTVATPLATTFHSFCYGLVREFSDAKDYAQPVTLLSAAEADHRIRELLTGGADGLAHPWPSRLLPALRTQGFAAELQRLMGATRALGLDPVDLEEYGALASRPDWDAASRFFEEYLDVLDAQNLLDYAELVHRARLVLEDHRAELLERFRFVVVDEYQDTDPAQVALLQALAGGGRDLVVVGDPDQSIYAFRGADVRGILEFPDRFRCADGSRAPVVGLARTRRFGPRLLRASRRVARRIPLGSLDQPARRFRDPLPTSGAGADELWLETYADAAAEAEHVAQMLRRAHLEEGTDWSDMAVLVRNGAVMGRLHRAMVAAGVPVEVAGSEVPLRAEPAVGALLGALDLALAVAKARDPEADAVERYLTGPIGRLDAGDVRVLCRSLRRWDAVDDDGAARSPRSSAELLAALVTDPLALGAVSRSRLGEVADRAGAAVSLLRRAAQQVARQEAPEQVLWTLWRGTDWESRLQQATAHGGEEAGAAHRDLDAVVALFALAARSEETQRQHRVAAFLDEVARHEVPSEPLPERGGRDSVVRLLTAHRAKGLEWDLVVVAGVQDEVWPDVRHTGTLLGAERLAGPESPAGDGTRPPATHAELLAAERRLFYVAITRARSRLVVTSVQSAAPDGAQPSEFLEDLRPLASRASRVPQPRPSRPLSLRGVVGELRELAQEGATEAVRDAAARRLAGLATSGLDQARGADPETWWGVREATETAEPIRPTDAPVRLSGSSLDGLVSCPLSWFLAHEARGETTSTTAQGFGLLVHALAADVVRGGSAADPRTLDAALDAVWDRLSFAAGWVSAREREQARDAIARFARWHHEQELSGTRTPLAAEHEFTVELPIAGDRVVLRGSMDRVELDAAGLVHVVDFKTGKSAVTAAQLAEHPQLGVYQLAVEHGAVDHLAASPQAASTGAASEDGTDGAGGTDSADGTDGAPLRGRSGGAELVHLRLPDSARTPDLPKVQPQDGPGEEAPFFAIELLEKAVRTVRDERFVATPSPQACRFCTFARVCPSRAEGMSVLAPGGAAVPRGDDPQAGGLPEEESA